MNPDLQYMSKFELEDILSIPYTARQTKDANNFNEEHSTWYNAICDSFEVEEENIEFRCAIERAKFVEFSEACEIRYQELCAQENKKGA